MEHLKIIAIIILFCSCETEKRPTPLNKSVTDNGYQVTLLFEVDSCKVYRFIDNYNYYYFTNCNGGTQWYESKPSGKSQIKIYHQINTTNNKT